MSMLFNFNLRVTQYTMMVTNQAHQIYDGIFYDMSDSETLILDRPVQSIGDA